MKTSTTNELEVAVPFVSGVPQAFYRLLVPE